MKTLIASLGISAALLAPAATFAATTSRPAATSTATPVATTVAPSQDKAEPARVAMTKQADRTGFGKQANDDRQGLSRIIEQLHQLGATN